MTMATEPTGLFTGKQTFQVTEKIQTYYKIIRNNTDTNLPASYLKKYISHHQTYILELKHIITYASKIKFTSSPT